MNPRTLRRVPWTCEWGRFGVAVEQLSWIDSRVDDVFWACHHPVRLPELRVVSRHECESCPAWVPAPRLTE
jgi:hypothetical protein